MPEQTNKGHVNRALAWILTAAVSLPLIYFLSIGPAIIVDFKAPISWRAPIEGFYAPVVWLDWNTFLKTPIDFYVRIWVGLAERI